jgi:uncharacterized membrane protein
MDCRVKPGNDDRIGGRPRSPLSFVVMPGLDPSIHSGDGRVRSSAAEWIAASNPAMTTELVDGRLRRRRNTAMIDAGLLFAALTSTPIAAAAPATIILAVSEAEILPDRLRCAGTEPFWSLSIDGAEAVFETPEAQGPSAARFAVHGRLNASNRFGLWALRMRSDAGQESVALVRQAACSDGMSDFEYSYTVALLDADDERSLLDGCCE